MKNEYIHITENITVIVCPLSIRKGSEEKSTEYRLAFVDRKDFEMLLQDRNSFWRATYKDNKFQVIGTFNGNYVRLARVIANVVKDKNRSVYIANKDEFDLRRDNLVVDLKGKQNDIALKAKLEKICSTLSKLPFVKTDAKGKPILDNYETNQEYQTVGLGNIPGKFKLSRTKTIRLELPNGQVQFFPVRDSTDEELIEKVMNFVSPCLG